MEDCRNDREKIVIGIDLGTTFSCVGYFKEDKNIVEIIPNEYGNRTTPSIVTFKNNEVIVGDDAKNGNIENTIFDIKRLMGLKIQDINIKDYPYKIEKIDDDGNICVNVTFNGVSTKFRPEEISAFILKKMKSDAEKHLGCIISDAVITVPAYFNDRQRKVTEIAGKLAGLNVMRIINEPTAGALAYGISRDETILVFDYGGGTLDVTILQLGDGIFKVLSTSGDTHLGGMDIDVILMNWVIKKLNRNTNDKIKKKIRFECEKVKKQLSNVNSANIEFEYDNEDISYNINREQFNELCHEEFERCMIPVKRSIADAKISKDKISKIVLVGGSSRIPKMRSMLIEYFDRDILCHGVNPDEAVAYGAALQAAKLNGSAQMTDIILVDVTPLSLGIMTKGGLMSNIILRNTTIPVEVTKLFSTTEDNQPSVTINIYEGERILAAENNLLGKFELVGLPSAKRGTLKIEVTFQINENGILNVTAMETSSARKNKITIENKERLSDIEIKQMISDAKKYNERDNENKNIVIIKNELENYGYNIRDFVNDNKEKMCKEDVRMCEILCEEIIFIQNCDNIDYKEISDKKLSIENRLMIIINNTYSNKNKI